MTLEECCSAVRAAAGLFDLPERGELRVEGDDRFRWLDGMITNDVKALEAAGVGALCRALLLTRQGRIVAEFRVLHEQDALSIAMPQGAIAATIEHLEGFIIADDVTLRDASEGLARFALEGPRSLEVLGAAAPGAPLPEPLGWTEVTVGGATLRAAGYSLIGSERAVQLFAPAEAADGVREVLLAAGSELGLVAADAETFECLRVEAGEPLLGRELDDSVLPAEVGLDEAVSETKGCYTGQEVVARMRSRGRANHRLVGLRFEAPPDPTAPSDRTLHVGDKKVGEITSQVVSPRFGPIGLAFVKSDQSERDTRIEAAQGSAVVVDVPFR